MKKTLRLASLCVVAVMPCLGVSSEATYYSLGFQEGLEEGNAIIAADFPDTLKAEGDILEASGYLTTAFYGDTGRLSDFERGQSDGIISAFDQWCQFYGIGIHLPDSTPAPVPFVSQDTTTTIKVRGQFRPCHNEK